MLVFQAFLLSAITCLGVTCHCQSLYESALPHEPVVFPWESIVYICFDPLIKYAGSRVSRRIAPSGCTSEQIYTGARTAGRRHIMDPLAALTDDVFAAFL